MADRVVVLSRRPGRVLEVVPDRARAAAGRGADGRARLRRRRRAHLGPHQVAGAGGAARGAALMAVARVAVRPRGLPAPPRAPRGAGPRPRRPSRALGGADADRLDARALPAVAAGRAARARRHGAPRASSSSTWRRACAASCWASPRRARGVAVGVAAASSRSPRRVGTAAHRRHLSHPQDRAPAAPDPLARDRRDVQGGGHRARRLLPDGDQHLRPVCARPIRCSCAPPSRSARGGGA